MAVLINCRLKRTSVGWNGGGETNTRFYNRIIAVRLSGLFDDDDDNDDGQRVFSKMPFVIPPDVCVRRRAKRNSKTHFPKKNKI